ncbi:histidine phosphatase family protein [Patescibacteria group bacterium]|nr:histidine phosphatase family protein [Patescibacteria group bacterium]
MRNKYILLRHGETIYQTKKDDLLYPWPDFITSLTKTGKKQAETAAKKLKSKKIDLIYSSDFLRARRTAEIVAKELGLKVKVDKRLRDINWGVYQDRPVKDYLQFFSSIKQRFSKRPPKGENWRDVKKRMMDFIKDIDKRHRNKKILIVSHGDPSWLLIGTMRGLNEDKLFKKRTERFSPYKDFYPNVGEFLKVK